PCCGGFFTHGSILPPFRNLPLQVSAGSSDEVEDGSDVEGEDGDISGVSDGVSSGDSVGDSDSSPPSSSSSSFASFSGVGSSQASTPIDASLSQLACTQSSPVWVRSMKYSEPSGPTR